MYKIKVNERFFLLDINELNAVLEKGKYVEIVEVLNV